MVQSVQRLIVYNYLGQHLSYGAWRSGVSGISKGTAGTIRQAFITYSWPMQCREAPAETAAREIRQQRPFQQPWQISYTSAAADGYPEPFGLSGAL